MSFSAKFLFRRNKEKTNPMVSMLSMGNSSENQINGLSIDGSVGGEHSSDKSVVNTSGNQSVRSASISTISGLHSHRNVKPVHQMLLAESMFEPSVPLNLKCRLNPTFAQILSDSNIFPYFIQFMESHEKESKRWIRFWIQTECLIVSQTNAFNQTKPNKQSFNDYKQQFINDSIGIYDKYLSDSLTDTLNVSKEIKTEIKEKLSKKSSEINENLFRRAQNYAIETMEDKYYALFLRSTYYFKYEVDLLTGDSVTIADVLFNNSDLATDFIEFMETEGMKIYVDFLTMFANYRKVSNDYDDAIALFTRFFNSDNTTHRLGFSDSLVLSLSEKLVKNNFSCDCLDKSAAILLQYFQKTYLKQFIESQFFVEYLNKCFQSIQTDVNTIKKAHNRTNSDSSFNSDCSSIAPIALRQRNHLSDDLKTDSLWRRDLSGKLQFTHVDPYGRISSCLEPEPDRSTSGALTKVMKKFSLHSTTDKDREEIAWKIAEMIINDVNNVVNSSNDTHD